MVTLPVIGESSPIRSSVPSVNHKLPSDPTVMLSGLVLVVPLRGTLYSVILLLTGENLPIWFVFDSVNHKLPSAPVVILSGHNVTRRIIGTVLDIHSHTGGVPAQFSPIDNDDEQGFRLYAVVGDLRNLCPTVEFRLGVYGYFLPLTAGQRSFNKSDLEKEAIMTKRRVKGKHHHQGRSASSWEYRRLIATRR